MAFCQPPVGSHQAAGTWRPPAAQAHQEEDADDHRDEDKEAFHWAAD
jgi:hypothetical protein